MRPVFFDICCLATPGADASRTRTSESQATPLAAVSRQSQPRMVKCRGPSVLMHAAQWGCGGGTRNSDLGASTDEALESRHSNVNANVDRR